MKQINTNMRVYIKILLVVVSQLAITETINAQVGNRRLMNVENFVPGFKMQYLQTKDSLPPIKTGDNMTWNFSSINLANADTINQEILNAEALPTHKKYPRANIVEKTSDGKVLFVEKTQTENKLWGIEQKDVNMVYTEPYLFIRRPFGYKDSIGSNPKRSYDTYGGVSGQGITRTVADGFGTLILPTGKFTKVTSIRFEQEFIDESPTSGKMKTKVSTYAWFDEAHSGTLLRISVVSISSQYYNNVFHTVDVLMSENGQPITAN